MVAIQLISARIGRVTGHGIAGNLRRHYPRPLLYGVVSLLVVANTINLGADLGAMAAALKLLVGGSQLLYVVLFGAISILLEIFIRYSRYVSTLKWLSLSLFAYVATVLVVGVPWGHVAHELIFPKISLKTDYMTMVVAILGTTISPYLFFWQAEEEVEDEEESPTAKPLVEAPSQGPFELERITLDTFFGMGISNIVALFIVLTTAVTLNAHGITDIQTSADAAAALRPIAGPFAFAVFAAGIIGTGLLALPVLAGSAAYAVGETFGWSVGLARLPAQAKAFYGAIAVATILGGLLNFTPIDPIKALFWSAVINGVVAVPILIGTMLVVSRRSTMGDFTASTMLKLFGWASTAVMAAAVIAMAVLPG